MELKPGVVPDDVAKNIWEAITKANSLQPSYSAVTHNAVILVQPDHHSPLPTTNKGNVQRTKVEKLFKDDLTAENPSVHIRRGIALSAVLPISMVTELDEQDWDSLDFTAKSGRTPPMMVKQFHAYFVAMIAIIIMHMCGARGGDQYAKFLDKAGTEPAFLRGLPRGAQLFALPTFIILMGVSDLKALAKPPKGGALQHIWRDIGRPFLLFFVCKYVLPFLAGQFLHPFYGLGKGGHVTFNWIFLFMVYARVTSQFLVRVCRLPRWAPAVIAFAVHFGCYAGATSCPSPFVRSYRLVGPLPNIINCPRFSVYYPFYAIAPMFISESLLLSEKLNKPVVRWTAIAVLAVAVSWAMGAFNLDESYMALTSYG